MFIRIPIVVGKENSEAEVTVHVDSIIGVALDADKKNTYINTVKYNYRSAVPYEQVVQRFTRLGLMIGEDIDGTTEGVPTVDTTELLHHQPKDEDSSTGRLQQGEWTF